MYESLRWIWAGSEHKAPVGYWDSWEVLLPGLFKQGRYQPAYPTMLVWFWLLQRPRTQVDPGWGHPNNDTLTSPGLMPSLLCGSLPAHRVECTSGWLSFFLVVSCAPHAVRNFNIMLQAGKRRSALLPRKSVLFSIERNSFSTTCFDHRLSCNDIPRRSS